MKSGRLRWSKTVGDFRSLELHAIDDFLEQRQRRVRASETSHDLNSCSAERIHGGGGSSEENDNYFPNVDTSVWTRSCEQEVVEPIHGTVTGTIPPWLQGVLLRNGPGSLKVGEYRFNHLFDSSALLHRFAIANGAVTYQRRFVETEAYKKNRAAQRIVVTEFGTRAVPDPCKTIFHRIAAAFNPADSLSDNSMISVYPFGDEYYTFTEAPVIHRIDPRTLETMGRVNVSKYVNIVNHTSHPHVMSDGSVYNVGTSISKRGPAYSVVRFNPKRLTVDEFGTEKKLSMFDQATVEATVPARWILNPSYMHTFGITDNYFVIVEQPLSVSLLGMLSCQMRQDAMISALKWHENENTLIHVVSRKTGETVHTFVAETFFYLHIINQFEARDGRYVVMDVCCYRDAKMLDCMYIDTLTNLHKEPDYANLFRGRPLRFVLPMQQLDRNTGLDQNLIVDDVVNREAHLDASEDFLNANSTTGECNEARTNPLDRKAAAHLLPNGEIFVTPELLCDLGCETPRVNTDFCLGKPYRFFYAISSDVDVEQPGSLVKVDTYTKTTKTWYERDTYTSEPIFVRDPGGKNEDDGLVLSALVFTNGRETEAGLLILDAVTFKEVARATFDTPGPVPKCLHGWFSMD